jgi:hypothetical protein
MKRGFSRRYQRRHAARGAACCLTLRSTPTCYGWLQPAHAGELKRYLAWRSVHSLSKALHRCGVIAPAAGVMRIGFRALAPHCSGGRTFTLGWVGAVASGRVRGLQKPGVHPFRLRAASWAGLHTFGVGTQACLRQSGAMRIPLTHLLLKSHLGAPAWLALFTAADNKAVNTEPQLQEAASPQRLWSGYRQRYMALASHA